MSAVYAHGTAPFSRIQATATEVSRPPEKAMPTRSPTGSDVRTLLTGDAFPSRSGTDRSQPGQLRELAGDLGAADAFGSDDEEGVVAGDGAEDGREGGTVEGGADDVGRPGRGAEH